jgi:RNA polymerase sigma-70 factor (ECF subfamily)
MEKEKIESLCRGNHKAFEDIFIAYFHKVKFFISGIIKSDADAEELAQDVFFRLWDNRDAIDPEKSFNAYIYTMARNAAFNYLKHKSVEQAYLIELPPLDMAASPEEILFAREISLLIELTVSEMPIQRKRIYLLSKKKGVSNADIALQLGISKKTVENQLSLALKEIRKVIALFFLFFH